MRRWAPWAAMALLAIGCAATASRTGLAQWLLLLALAGLWHRRLGAAALRLLLGGDDPGAAATAVDGSLNCHGYGSSVMVTAAFGMVAAAQGLEALWAAAAAPKAGQKADIL